MPGVIYGGDGEPSHFSVDAPILRNTLAHSGAILDISIDGGKASPVLVKDLQRHPVRGEIVHVDFLRVNMNETIHMTVVLSCRRGRRARCDRGRRALPGDARAQHRGAAREHPALITHDVSGMQINETPTLSAVTAPDGVTLFDDLDETVVATITPPTLEPVEDEIETETALVGEEGEAAEGEADGGGEGAAESSIES